MSDISFSTDEIQQAFCNLYVNEASGPDHIPPYIFKNCAVSPVLKAIYSLSCLQQVLYLKTGLQLTFVQFTKKEDVMMLLTTDPFH